MPVLDPPEDRLTGLEPVQDERERVIGYRDLETGEMLTARENLTGPADGRVFLRPVFALP